MTTHLVALLVLALGAERPTAFYAFNESGPSALGVTSHTGTS